MIQTEGERNTDWASKEVKKIKKPAKFDLWVTPTLKCNTPNHDKLKTIVFNNVS